MKDLLNKVMLYCTKNKGTIINWIVVVLTIVVAFLILSMIEVNAGEICFSEKDATNILLELDEKDKLEKLMIQYEELDKQYFEEVKELSLYLSKCEDTLSDGKIIISGYKRLVESHEETAKKVEVANFWGKVKSFITGMGAGAVIVLVLLI